MNLTFLLVSTVLVVLMYMLGSAVVAREKAFTISMELLFCFGALCSVAGFIRWSSKDSIGSAVMTGVGVLAALGVMALVAARKKD